MKRETIRETWNYKQKKQHFFEWYKPIEAKIKKPPKNPIPCKILRE